MTEAQRLWKEKYSKDNEALKDFEKLILGEDEILSEEEDKNKKKTAISSQVVQPFVISKVGKDKEKPPRGRQAPDLDSIQQSRLIHV